MSLYEQKQRIMNLDFKKKMSTFLWIAPAIIVLFIGLAYPFLKSLRLSFFEYNLLRPYAGEKFIGLKNYLDILKNNKFWDSLKLTMIFTTGTVVLQMTLGMLGALFLNKDRPGRSVMRVLAILPMLLSPVAVSMMWKLMWDTEFGMVNYFMRTLGLSTQIWLGIKNAMFSLIVTDVWQHVGFVLLMILAGLTSLPEEPFEASIVDGASKWQIFRHITVPLMVPIIVISLLFRTMFALRLFDTVFVLTAGGPGDSTMVLSILLYREGFRYYNMGTASALSWILLLITALICGIIILLNRRFKTEL